MAHHITKRGNVYYLRRRVPLELIEQYSGRREMVRSHGVKDRAMAEREARRISVALDNKFDHARRSMAVEEPRPQPILAASMEPAYWDEAASHIHAEEVAKDLDRWEEGGSPRRSRGGPPGAGFCHH